MNILLCTIAHYIISTVRMYMHTFAGSSGLLHSSKSAVIGRPAIPSLSNGDRKVMR